MEQHVLDRLRINFHVGSEDWNAVTCKGQRTRWMKGPQLGSCIEVSQRKIFDGLEDIPVERNTIEDLHCSLQCITWYRSLLGQINWRQSRTLQRQLRQQLVT